MAHQTYNKEKDEWSDYVFANSGRQSTPSYNYSSSNWQSDFYDIARQCPVEIENGVTIQSVSVYSNSVTITLRLTAVSKYELDSSNEATLRDFKNNYRNYFKQYVPSSVSVYMYLQDKAGRSI